MGPLRQVNQGKNPLRRGREQDLTDSFDLSSVGEVIGPSIVSRRRIAWVETKQGSRQGGRDAAVETAKGHKHAVRDKTEESRRSLALAFSYRRILV